MKRELANDLLKELEDLNVLKKFIQLEDTAIPVDYITPVTAMFVEEFQREIEFLKDALRDPDRFEDQFKARCAERELDIENNFSFQYSPDSLTNNVYWNVAKVVFEPASMKEILGILLPGIKYQLKVDVQYTPSAGGVPKAAPLLIEDKQLAALDAMEPDHNLFMRFCVLEDVIFDVQSIALFPLKLQSQFNRLLTSEYPKFAKVLYQHNSSLTNLFDNILALNNKGKTPNRPWKNLCRI